MKKNFACMFLIVLLSIPFAASSAQSNRTFATQGSLELGGNIAFQRNTYVNNGTSAEVTSVFSLAPFIGYFVADGFEIGFNPLGVSLVDYEGGSGTQPMIFVAPSYNMKTESIAYPFVEALLGYSSQSTSGDFSRDESGFSWGGRAGVKLAVAEQGLLNLGVQYVQITLTPEGASNRYGSNQLTISAGFTIWY